MQELLDDIEKYIKVDWPMNIVIRTTINNALAKEKEQIIDACNSILEDSSTWGERYYNQKYQNK